MNFNINNYGTVNLDLDLFLNIHTLSYTIRYASGVETFNLNYRVRYESESLSLTTNTYRIRYDSTNDNDTLNYRIRYTANVEESNYTLMYNLRYESESLLNYSNTYKIRFESDSISTYLEKIIYRIRYETEGISTNTSKHLIKYQTESPDLISLNYSIKYTSESASSVISIPILLKDTNENSHILFGIYTKNNIDLENYLYVFSNLPKYQLLEFEITEELLPYLTVYPKDTFFDYNLELVQREELLDYECACYILIKNVEELNSFSLDLYDKGNEYNQINNAKSYFFDLSPVSFVPQNFIEDGITYVYSNTTSEYYDSRYLNFSTEQITLTYRIVDNCCFNQKISLKPKPTPCSPF